MTFLSHGVTGEPSTPLGSGAESDPWTVCGNVPLPKFVIQCHRGAGELYPENTLEAFEYAWGLGTVPEADLRTTRDGVMVAFHDRNFQRVVKDPGPKLAGKSVVDFIFADLADIDVGAFRGDLFAGQRIPTMESVFEAMRGRPEREIYLDIKEVDLKALAAMVKEMGVSRQVIFTSTHYDLIREWKTMVPESQSLNWMGGTEEVLRGRLAVLREAGFEGITQLQLHIRMNPEPGGEESFHLSRRFIREVGEELRSHGILFQTLPWRLADREVFWRLLDLGVASFATDFPEETLQTVREYYERRD
jgi:glycerophosphoryl diester phosphodiesterase